MEVPLRTWFSFVLCFGVCCMFVAAVDNTPGSGSCDAPVSKDCLNYNASQSRWYYKTVNPVSPHCVRIPGVCLDKLTGFETRSECMLACASVVSDPSKDPCDTLRCPLGTVCKVTSDNSANPGKSTASCTKYDKPCLVPPKGDQQVWNLPKLIKEQVAENIPGFCSALDTVTIPGAGEKFGAAKKFLCPPSDSSCDVCDASKCLRPYHEVISRRNKDDDAKRKSEKEDETRRSEKDETKGSEKEAEKCPMATRHPSDGICRKFLESKKCVTDTLSTCPKSELSYLKEHIRKMSRNVKEYCHTELVMNLMKFGKMSAKILTYQDDSDDYCDEDDSEDSPRRRCTCDIGKCPKKSTEDKESGNKSKSSSSSSESDSSDSNEKKEESKKKDKDEKGGKEKDKDEKGGKKKDKDEKGGKEKGKDEKGGKEKGKDDNDKKEKKKPSKEKSKSDNDSKEGKGNKEKSKGSSEKTKHDDEDRRKQFCQLCKDLDSLTETVSSSLSSLDENERSSVNKTVISVLSLVQQKCQFVTEAKVDPCKMEKAMSCAVSSLYNADNSLSALGKVFNILTVATRPCKGTECPQVSFEDSCEKKRCPGFFPALKCIQKFHKDLVFWKEDKAISRSKFDTERCVNEEMSNCNNSGIKILFENKLKQLGNEINTDGNMQGSLKESISGFKDAVSELLKFSSFKDDDKCGEKGSGSKSSGSDTKERSSDSSEKDSDGDSKENQKDSGGKSKKDQKDDGKSKKDKKDDGKSEKDKKDDGKSKKDKKNSGSDSKKDKNKSGGDSKKDKKGSSGSNEKDERQRECKSPDHKESSEAMKMKRLCATVEYHVMGINNHIDGTDMTQIAINGTVHAVLKEVFSICRKDKPGKSEKSCNLKKRIGCALSFLSNVMDSDSSCRDIEMSVKCMSQGTGNPKFGTNTLSFVGKRLYKNINMICISTEEEACVRKGRTCLMHFQNKKMLSKSENHCHLATTTKQCIEDAFEDCDNQQTRKVWEKFSKLSKDLPKCCKMKTDKPKETIEDIKNIKKCLDNLKDKTLLVLGDASDENCEASSKAAECVDKYVERLSPFKKLILSKSYGLVKSALKLLCDSPVQIDLTGCSLKQVTITIFETALLAVQEEDVNCTILTEKFKTVAAVAKVCKPPLIGKVISDALTEFSTSTLVQAKCYKSKRCGMPGAHYLRLFLQWPFLSKSTICKKRKETLTGIMDASKLNKCEKEDRTEIFSVMNMNDRVIGNSCPQCENEDWNGDGTIDCPAPENNCKIAKTAPACFATLENTDENSNACELLNEARSCLDAAGQNCKAFETISWRIKLAKSMTRFDTSTCSLDKSVPDDSDMTACHSAFVRDASQHLRKASKTICSSREDFKKCLGNLDSSFSAKYLFPPNVDDLDFILGHLNCNGEEPGSQPDLSKEPADCKYVEAARRTIELMLRHLAHNRATDNDKHSFCKDVHSGSLDVSSLVGSCSDPVKNYFTDISTPLHSKFTDWLCSPKWKYDTPTCSVEMGKKCLKNIPQYSQNPEIAKEGRCLAFENAASCVSVYNNGCSENNATVLNNALKNCAYMVGRWCSLETNKIFCPPSKTEELGNNPVTEICEFNELKSIASDYKRRAFSLVLNPKELCRISKEVVDKISGKMTGCNGNKMQPVISLLKKGFDWLDSDCGASLNSIPEADSQGKVCVSPLSKLCQLEEATMFIEQMKGTEEKKSCELEKVKKAFDGVNKNVAGCMPLAADLLKYKFVKAAPENCALPEPPISDLAKGISDCVAEFKTGMMKAVAESTNPKDIGKAVLALKTCQELAMSKTSDTDVIIPVYSKVLETLKTAAEKLSEIEEREFVAQEDGPDCSVKAAFDCLDPHTYHMMFFGPLGMIANRRHFISSTYGGIENCMRKAASDCSQPRKYMFNMLQSIHNTIIAKFFSDSATPDCVPEVIQASLSNLGKILDKHDVVQEKETVCRGLSQVKYDFNLFTEPCAESIKKGSMSYFNKVRSVTKTICDKFEEKKKPEKPEPRPLLFPDPEPPELDDEDKKCLRPQNQEYICNAEKAIKCITDLKTFLRTRGSNETAGNREIEKQLKCAVENSKGCKSDQSSIKTKIDGIKKMVEGRPLIFYVPEMCEFCSKAKLSACVQEISNTDEKKKCSVINSAKICIDELEDMCEEAIITEAREALDKNMEHSQLLCENQGVLNNFEDFAELCLKILSGSDTSSACEDLESYHEEVKNGIDNSDGVSSKVVLMQQAILSFLKELVEQKCKERTLKCISCSQTGNSYYPLSECNKEQECKEKDPVCQTIIKTVPNKQPVYSKGCKNRNACHRGAKGIRETFCCDNYLCNDQPNQDSKVDVVCNRPAIFEFAKKFFYQCFEIKEPSELCSEIQSLKKSFHDVTKTCSSFEKQNILDKFSTLEAVVTDNSCEKPKSECNEDGVVDCLKQLGGDTSEKKRSSILPVLSCVNQALVGCAEDVKLEERITFKAAVEKLEVSSPDFPDFEFGSTERVLNIVPAGLPSRISVSLSSPPQTGLTVTFRLQVDKQENGQSPYLLIDRCSSEFTEETWSDEQSYSFYAKIDSKQRGRKKVIVNAFADYKQQSSVTTVLVDKFIFFIDYGAKQLAKCSTINDPHIITYDKFKYNSFYNGEFTMTKNPAMDYEVHAVFGKCARANCNCACIVRYKKHLVAFDRCPRKSKQGKKNRKLRVQVWGNDPLPENLHVTKSRTGDSYKVTLPHGTVVKVKSRNAKRFRGERRFLNIYIYEGGFGRRSLEGLCGNFDGSMGNDLKAADGTYFTNLSPKEKKFPRDFSKSWRMPWSESYLLGNIKLDNTPEEDQLNYPTKLCTCVTGSTESDVCETSVADSSMSEIDNEITSDLVMHSVETNSFRKRRKRQASNNDIDIDTNEEPATIEWPTPSGWTLDTATAFCTQELNNDTAVSKCLQLGQSVDDEINNCVSDIQSSDGTEWASEAKDDIITNCIEYIEQNPSLSTNPDTKILVDGIKSLSCVNDCNTPHGTCTVAGICECKGGYSGADCTILPDAVPSLDEDKDFCKVSSPQDCVKISVPGENYKESDKLTCHIEEMIVAENGAISESGKIKEVKAIFETDESIQCALPAELSSRTPIVVALKISNNGITTSNSMKYHAYDPDCFSCTDSVCTRQPDTCVIDNQCYVDKETDPKQSCYFCDPSKPNEWSISSDYSCDAYSGYGKDTFDIATRLGIGVAVIAFIILIIVVILLYKRQSRLNKKDNDKEAIVDESSEGKPSPLAFTNAPYMSNVPQGVTLSGDKLDKMALSPDGTSGWVSTSKDPAVYVPENEYSSRIHRNLQFHTSFKDGIPTRINSKEYKYEV